MTGAPLVEVADGVHAWVQPVGGWCVNNAALVTGGPPLLVDTAATQARAERLRAAVLATAGRAPRVVVNTHAHGDHTFGNARFAGATVVGHHAMRAEQLAVGHGLRQLWPDVEWGDTTLVPPDLTVGDGAVLHVGDTVVELLHPGPAHTTGDLVGWLPRQRVVLAGDVVMSGVTPFALMGSITGTLAALDRIAALDPAVIVPGHGPVGGPELLAQNRRYLRWVQEIAAAGRAAGAAVLEVAGSVDLGEFAGLHDSERLVGNLHRAYAELERPDAPGRPLDVAAAFAEMVAFHGDLPACAA